MSFEMLEKIKTPDDVKAIAPEQLPKLCEEIREKLIDVVSVNGGHLSSNLGVVELTVAMHRVFDCPRDSIVFDVGHQCYTHKMLTGRYNTISTIRQKGGLSGFPKISESEYDAFNAGHSSTSISAAYGIARAKMLTGDDSYTVAVIGDGSLTGGLAYEGLNNAGRINKNFIVILNDNKMSISKNVGAVARHLTHIRVKPSYLRFKSRAERVISKIPLIGRPLGESLRRSKARVKHLVYRRTIFDKLGFSFYGPVDGHDLSALQNALMAAKRAKGPVLLHVVTKKGKGYKFAEDDSAHYHGIGSFNIDTGESMSGKKSYSDVFGRELCCLAADDERICAVTAAMRTGTGLVDFSHDFRDRFFDVGIAEQHAVTFSAGLAIRGLLPVFAVYSTFMQRSYDQILHDAAMQKAHMVLAVDRAGVVGEDGETHQGLFDVSMMSPIPNTSIYSPCYFEGLRACLKTALYEDKNVVSVRYPRGGEGYRPKDFRAESVDFDIYGNRDADILLVTYGRLFSECAKSLIALKKKGVRACVLKLCCVKPIDRNAVRFARNFSQIFFFEEGVRRGGIAEQMFDALNEKGYKGAYNITAVEDMFVQHSATEAALKSLGLDSGSMTKTILKAKYEKTT